MKTLVKIIICCETCGHYEQYNDENNGMIIRRICKLKACDVFSKGSCRQWKQNGSEYD